MDDIDRKIVHALQIAPRAPWNLVGSAVGIDPVTAARRWQRLHDAGVGWISCYPFVRTGGDSFLVELTCDPGTSVDVATVLARDHNVVSVNVKAGGHDVLAEVGTANPRDSARYSLGRLGRVPGIRSIRTLPIAMAYSEGSRWRLRALDREAEARLVATMPEPPDPAVSGPPLSDDDWEMVHCLADNPRMPLSEIGERLSISPSTARRRLGAVSDGRIRLRCELARTQSGWPVYGTFFANCPADRVGVTARALVKIPEVRAVTSLIGPFNLYLALWLRSIADIQEFESQLNVKVPHMSIADRSLVLRPVKQMGQLLDEDGKRIGNVPIDIRSVPV
jgi:DNA-binding Lrp family transcriptional regulator